MSYIDNHIDARLFTILIRLRDLTMVSDVNKLTKTKVIYNDAHKKKSF